MRTLLWTLLAGFGAGAVVLLQSWDRGRVSASAAQEAQEPPRGDASYRQRLGIETYHHYCETCHGAEGKGDGFNAFNLDPKPPDFSTPAFQDTRTDEQLAAAIANGGLAVSRSAGMPPWGRTLSSSKRSAVLLHIRHFRR